MTIWTNEQSVASSQPVELVDLLCAGEHWRKCSGPLAVSYLGETWTPQAGLSVGEIAETGNYLRNRCEIETAWSDAYVQRFPGTPPDAITSVTVYRLQGAESSLWWSGYVKTVRRRQSEDRRDRKAVLTCTASLSELGLATLCLRSGRLCQVPFGSTLCGVDASAYEDTGVIEACDASTLISATFAAEEDTWYTGGLIAANGYLRMIIDHTGDTVVVTDPIPGLEAGDSFTASPGCDGTMTMCDGRYDNALNYKGWEHMPTKDPFQGVF